MKPHVICLMAASVDGRTLHSRWRPKGSAADLFERVHDELAGDAWLVGRVTGQEFAKGKPYPASTKETFPRRFRMLTWRGCVARACPTSSPESRSSISPSHWTSSIANSA